MERERKPDQPIINMNPHPPSWSTRRCKHPETIRYHQPLIQINTLPGHDPSLLLAGEALPVTEMGTPDIQIGIKLEPRAEELLRDTSIREHNRSSASGPNSDGGNSVGASRPRPDAALHMDLELHEADAALPIELELHKAARNFRNRDDFERALHKVSTEKHQHVAETVKSLSPARNTLAHTAALSRNPDVLAYLLETYPQIVFEKNLRGDTALHAAAKSGFKDGICYILNLSLPLDAPSLLPEFLRVKNQVGNTALHEAFLSENPEVSAPMFEKDPQLSFYPNDEGKSPFYLAAEAGLSDLVGLMLRRHTGDTNPDGMLKGKCSPLLAAVTNAATTKKTDILEVMLEAEPRLISRRDEEGRSMLHYAAYVGYLEGVRFLVGKYIQSAYQWDKLGFYPIHLASMEGHVDVVKELFRHCPDPEELLTENSQNVLHISCCSRRHNVVKYILSSSRLEELINQRDKDGNTPLHLATLQGCPYVVRRLTWDYRVNLGLTNNQGLTAMDVVMSLLRESPSWEKWGTWHALKKVKAPRTHVIVSPMTQNQGNLVMRDFIANNIKDLVSTFLVVSTLVATVTFAASFQVPGGYNDSDPDQGTATLLQHKAFQVFIFCDTLAFYSSVVAMLALIFAQMVLIFGRTARRLVTFLEIFLLPAAIALITALLTMSMAFLAGTFLVVSILKWLSICLLVGGVAYVVGFYLFNPFADLAVYSKLPLPITILFLRALPATILTSQFYRKWRPRGPSRYEKPK